MNAGKTPKGTKTKNRIIESAVKLINTRGIENTTLVEICTESAIAQGTFYHYFKSINDILYELLRIEGEELSDYFNSIRKDPAAEQLEKILLFQMRYYEKKGKAVVAQILGNEFTGSSRESRVEKLLPIKYVITQIILDGQKAGVFSLKSSPEKTSTVIIALFLIYSHQWIHDNSGLSLRDIAADHISGMIELMLLK